MPAGAPVGNKNAAYPRRWREAILRALSRASNENIDKGLDDAADKLISMALNGDRWAIDHMADRVEGKVPQAIKHSGDDEGDPIRLVWPLSKTNLDK